MTNTERLIASLKHAIAQGSPSINFMTGKYTGNNPSVVAALRRRGYSVKRVPAGGCAAYVLSDKPAS